MTSKYYDLRQMTPDGLRAGQVLNGGKPAVDAFTNTHGRAGRARHDELYVVVSIFNPRRFESRLRLFREFERYVHASGAQLFVVEAAFGDRPHEVTQADNPMHLQVRTNEELWHKERLLNLGIQRLPAEAKYVAWLDPDVHFTRHDWASETVHVLQHHPVAQMFGQASNLGPNEEILWTARGIAKGWEQFGKPVWECPDKVLRGVKDHPGLGWAFRREALDAMGGLLDFCIAGSADLHMVGAWSGNYLLGHPKDLSPAYREYLRRWAERAHAVVQGNVGHVPGTALHHWHGKTKDRGYDRRWDIMVEHGFDPSVDLITDTQGMLRWSGRNPELAIAIKRSLAGRNEDSIEA
jgi:hypothetical protein